MERTSLKGRSWLTRGEAGVFDASGSSSIRTPELRTAAVCSGRGRTWRYAARKCASLCQKHAHGLQKKKKGDERTRGCGGSPKTEEFAGGNGGRRRATAASLVARLLGFRGGKGGGGAGVYMGPKGGNHSRRIRRILETNRMRKSRARFGQRLKTTPWQVGPTVRDFSFSFSDFLFS